VQSIQQAFSAIWRLVSGLSKLLEIRTFSIIFAKPGLMADTLLILTLPSFRSLPLFLMTMLSFSPICWWRSWASPDMVQPFTTRLLKKAPKASCMTCAMSGMWFLNAGHLTPDVSKVDCSPQVIEQFEESLSCATRSKRLSVSSKRSRISSRCTASLSPVCWPWSYHPYLAIEKWRE